MFLNDNFFVLCTLFQKQIPGTGCVYTASSDPLTRIRRIPSAINISSLNQTTVSTNYRLLNRIGLPIKSENFMNKYKFLLFVLCFLVNCLAAQEMPQVQGDFLYFPKGNMRIFIKNDNTDLENVYNVFSTQERVVVIYQERIPNLRKIQIKFYDFFGNEISRSKIISGEFDFFFMERQSRLLIGQKAKLVEANDSYLFDLDGNLINVLFHDYLTKDIGVTFDEKYVWFASNKARRRKEGEPPLYPYYPTYPYTADNYIMIFDTKAGDLQKELLVGGTQTEITINDINYVLNFSPPDMPG
jgi:hypothetical protein